MLNIFTFFKEQIILFLFYCILFYLFYFTILLFLFKSFLINFNINKNMELEFVKQGLKEFVLENYKTSVDQFSKALEKNPNCTVRVNTNLSYQGGWVRREAHKTIPQKYAFIQRIKAKKEAAGIGEAEDSSQEFWLEVMKEDYPWMKQVRPLKRLWDQRKKIEKEFEELSKTTGQPHAKGSK